MAYCNYLAHITKISQKLKPDVENIPGDVPTRWNSYLDSAAALYKERSRLREYLDNTLSTCEITSQLRSRVQNLNQGWSRVLHDLIAVLKPIGDLTIEEEGELYVTSSIVVSRLLSEKEHIDRVMELAELGESYEEKIIHPATVK